MCTAITLQSVQGECFFGRTMDFSYPLDPHLYVVPRNYQWNNLRNTHNIRNPYSYMGIGQGQEARWGSVMLTPFGQGAGAFGLPGDYSPPSRFVRTAWQKTHVTAPKDREDAVAACFHIMEGVSIPKGCVITDRGVPDYTQYTAFMNLSRPEYYFRTYDNAGIVSARLTPELSGGTGIRSLGKLLRPVVPEHWGQ